MNENLQNIWVLGSSYTLIALTILQIIDLAFTLVHALQERKGQLWRYFGAIAGVKIPDGFGLVLFFVVLTISLWTVGLLGITATVLWQTPLAFGCLGAIIGCRLISHPNLEDHRELGIRADRAVAERQSATQVVRRGVRSAPVSWTPKPHVSSLRSFSVDSLTANRSANRTGRRSCAVGHGDHGAYI